jgi:hypothetical protein
MMVNCFSSHSCVPLPSFRPKSRAPHHFQTHKLNILQAPGNGSKFFELLFALADWLSTTNQGEPFENMNPKVSMHYLERQNPTI